MLLSRQCCSLWHGLVFLFSAKVWTLKIENCNQFSIFVFRPKYSKSLTEITKREGGGLHSHGNFSPSALSPWPGPFPRLRGLGRKWELNCLRSITTVKYNKVSIVCRSTVAHPLSLLNWSVEILNTKDLKLGCCNWCSLSLDASERISEKLLVVHSKGRRWIFEACRCLMRWLKIAMMR